MTKATTTNLSMPSAEAKLGLQVEDLWDVQAPQLDPADKLNTCFEEIPVSSFPRASFSSVEIDSESSLAEAVRVLAKHRLLSAPVVDAHAPKDASWVDRYIGVVEFAGIVVWILQQAEADESLGAALAAGNDETESDSPTTHSRVRRLAKLGSLSPRAARMISGDFFGALTSSKFYKNVKVPGGTMRDSFLVNGVAFKKTFSYAGFEQQPKKFLNPKILLLNIELELKSEKENAEIRLSDPSQYQSIVDAEWNIIYDKLDKCVQSGAKIVLSRLAIGDLATQYFADRDIFCAGRVTEEDLQRVVAASGGTVQTSVNNVIDEVLGSCEVFEEKQVGNERFNIFSGCPCGRTATIVLRGGADQFIDEAERSLHDAIMIVRRALKNSTVVPGGGAIDMEISRHLRQHARTIAGKAQLFINYAKALEVIPRQLCESCDNAGFDATDVLNKLRQKHGE